MVFEGDTSFLNNRSVDSYKNYNGMAEIKLRDGADAQNLLAEAVSKARITRFEVMEPTLEEIFIETVGDRVDA